MPGKHRIGEDGTRGLIPDGLAAALSSLCLLHCLLMPLGVGLLPLFAGLSADALEGPEWLHWALLLMALPFSIHALWKGLENHGRPAPARMAALGFTLMAAGALAHGHHLLEQLLTVGGGLMIAWAHWRNWKLRAALS
ncbi:MerC domain-containing protein [Sandaracinobacteroides sp. A072]|uniref:MerC domain-containing protein n=1 Tax=Sandaracinobacteroides sp. A072 TaxID=3461146 RepID=UPI004041DC80